MGEVHFYHLTRSPADVALRQLLERVLARGWRAAVRAPGDRLDWLDRQLWLGPEDGFLPHGRDGGPHDARQPVLLTGAAAPANAPEVLFALDGAAVTAAEAARHERLCILFDGADAVALDHARGQWAALAGAGCPARYWSQESGRWQEKATRNLPGVSG
jgi:DNA polymerase III subunit chi